VDRSPGPKNALRTKETLLALVLRRLLGAIPLLLGVATLVFIGLSLFPGDPATLYVPVGSSPELLEEVRRNMGLDDPLLVRYVRWLAGVFQGDFGDSIAYGMPVRDRILAVLPNTLILTGTALILAFVLGVLTGVVQAMRRGTLLDGLLTTVTLFFYSMPSFWLAIMLVMAFSVGAGALWGWPVSFPVSGMASPGADLLGSWGQLKDRLHHLALPALTLTLILMGGVARYARTSMLEVLGQDYIRTARAKGLAESQVVLKHGLRNGLIPLVSLFGVYFPFLLSGAVLVEYVFAWPGMGQLMVDSILRRDLPVVLAATFLFGVLVILGNLLADILYGIVDPRIRERHG
jgi:peptide/nickel transport system permease protein